MGSNQYCGPEYSRLAGTTDSGDSDDGHPEGEHHRQGNAAHRAGRRKGRRPSSKDHSSCGGATRESSRQADRHSAIRWITPGVALFVACFIQSTGLYFGTRCYIRWMDVIHRPMDGADGAASMSDAAKQLDDPSDMLVPYSHMSTFAMDFTNNVIMVVWLGWMTRSRDLRIWTRTLLTASLLALLKGFLSWASVSPDAAGWESCKARLGVDGLKYYRRKIGFDVAEKELEFGEVFFDILLLEVHVWSHGQQARDRFCADTMFCSSTSFSVLFSVSLYEAVRSSTEQLQLAQHMTIRIITRCILATVILTGLVVPVINRHHYVADVVAAVVLTLFIYSSAGVAVAVERFALADWAQASSPPPEPGMVEAGSILVWPCCCPLFGSLEGLYYLHSEQRDSKQVPWEEGAESRCRTQLRHFELTKEQQANHLKNAKAMLEEEKSAAHMSAMHHAAAMERRFNAALSDEMCRLDLEERRRHQKPNQDKT